MAKTPARRSPFEDPLPGHLVVQPSTGKQAHLPRKQSECYDVAEMKPLPGALGEHLLLQASRSSKTADHG